MERTITGIDGDVRHSVILSAWITREPFQFPGDPTFYVVVAYAVYYTAEGTQYEAVLKVADNGDRH